MARHALGPARLRLVDALQSRLTDLDQGVLVACSGGADSLALADAAAVLGARNGTAVSAVVVDHRLQPGSTAVADRARATLVGLGLTDVRTVAVDVADHGLGPEAAAREARYAALRAESVRRGGATVLLGHTRDDQAETVLLGLARGSGPRSLSGMAVRTGPFLRPFLSVPRTATAAACAELGIEPWRDPHNLDPAYARSRVRHRVLPLLEAELGPGIADALARTAALARDDADLLDALAVEALTAVTSGRELDCRGLAELPRPIRRRVLMGWLERGGARDLAQPHVAAVDALVVGWHGQGPVDVPGLSVVRRSGRLAVHDVH